MLQQVELASTFFNKFFQLATTNFVAWQCLRWVVIRATTLFNLQRNNVALQVAAICCSYFFTISIPTIVKETLCLVQCSLLDTNQQKTWRNVIICYKRAKRTSVNWCEYKRLRNCTNAAVKRAKESYHKSLVEEHSKDNPKAFLRTIKKLVPDPDKNP